MASWAIYHQKGGVGKTAASVNLAYLAASNGYKTLLWDTDSQAASSFYFEQQAHTKQQSKKLFLQDISLLDVAEETAFENLWLVAADKSASEADVLAYEIKNFKRKLGQTLKLAAKEFDLVIIDCAPGLSYLHDAVFDAADAIILPTIPTTLSIHALEQVQAHFAAKGLPAEKMKCFFSMVDHRKNLHHETMQQYYKQKLFCKSYIPYLSDIEKMGIQRQPVTAYAPNSYASQCYTDVWKELKKQFL
jgi:chromosome partitioning protein